MTRFRQVYSKSAIPTKLARSEDPDATHAALLRFWLLTGHYSTNIPGVAHGCPRVWAAALPLCDEERAERAMRLLVSLGLARWDADSGLVWLPDVLSTTKAPGPRQAKGWANTARDSLPACPLLVDILRAYGRVGAESCIDIADEIAQEIGLDTVSDTVSDTVEDKKKKKNKNKDNFFLRLVEPEAKSSSTKPRMREGCPWPQPREDEKDPLVLAQWEILAWRAKLMRGAQLDTRGLVTVVSEWPGRRDLVPGVVTADHRRLAERTLRARGLRWKDLRRVIQFKAEEIRRQPTHSGAAGQQPVATIRYMNLEHFLRPRNFDRLADSPWLETARKSVTATTSEDVEELKSEVNQSVVALIEGR